MDWNRFKIRLDPKRGGYASLLFRRFCEIWLPSIMAFVWLPPDCRLVISQTTSAPRLRGATWSNYPVTPGRSCFERRGSKERRRNCEAPATSSAATVLL